MKFSKMGFCGFLDNFLNQFCIRDAALLNSSKTFRYVVILDVRFIESSLKGSFFDVVRVNLVFPL